MKEPVTPHQPASTTDPDAAAWRLEGASGRQGRIIKSLFLEDGALADQNMALAAKYAAMEAEVRAESFLVDDADLIVVAYGSIGRIVKSTIRKLRSQGLKVGLVRPISLLPFPSTLLRSLAQAGKRFLTIEHNLGQMVDDVRLAIRTIADSAFHGHLPGDLPTPDDFEAPIRNTLDMTN